MLAFGIGSGGQSSTSRLAHAATKCFRSVFGERCRGFCFLGEWEGYRDGYLDLYVGAYVALDPDGPRYCTVGKLQTSCPPRAYRGSPNALYHNNGDGTFTNVSVASKVFQPQGKNLAVGAADYDNDGWPDLFVANDGLEVYLYHNEHNGTFKEVGADVEKGDNLSVALSRKTIFPPMLLRMVAAGEATGKIDTMLEKMADFWDEEIEAMLDALTSLIEPLLIVFLGVIVGGIVIAMFLPIFKLNEVVSQTKSN